MASLKMEPELDDNPPTDTSSEADSETALLLANIASALRSVEKAHPAEDKQESLGSLELALHTYGSVKHLLPKLNLNALQRAPVEKALQQLRAQILDEGRKQV
jgi:hypothetical protein